MMDFMLHGTLDAPAGRIVSLAPSLTEILFSLGLEPKVCGVTEQCDYPHEARQKETIGSFAAPDVERILRMKPDLVLSLGRIHARYRDVLLTKGIAVLDMEPVSVWGILSAMKETGRLGGAERGAAYVASLRRRVRKCADRAAGKPRPRIFRLMSQDPIVTPSPSCYQSDAIRLAGGVTMPIESSEPWARVSLDDVLRYDPQIIISCGRADGRETRERCPGCKSAKPVCQRLVSEVRFWEGWSSTTAAMNGGIHAVQCGFLCRPGPRIVDGIEWLSVLL